MEGTETEAGTAAAVVEEVVVVVAAVEEAAVEGLGRVVGTPPGLHSARGDPAEGWETFPSGPASARCCKPAGSWAQVRG